ncbi:MAG: cytochrome c5 family protein [Burkholderiales bacterium]
MSEHEETSFIKTPQQLVVVILLAFIVPIFGIVLIVKYVIEKPKADPGALAPQAVAERIQPVGRWDPSAPAESAGSAAPAAASAAAGPADPKKTYQTVCAACHAQSVAGSPKFGDKAAWAPRIATGVDAMVKSVVGGKGAMPPKGGNAALTEADIRGVVEYMVSQSK